MFQLHVPRKTTSLIQVWGCVALAIICVFLSFAPLITLDTGSNAQAIEEGINELFKDQNVKVDIPEKVEVSTGKLVGSISLVVDVVKVLSEEAKAANAAVNNAANGVVDNSYTTGTTNNTANNSNNSMKKLEELLLSEDGKNTLVTVFAIANSVTEATGAGEGESVSGVSAILSVVVVFLAILYVLVFTLIFPVIFIITALIMLITALAKMKNPLEAAPKISKKLPGLVMLPMFFMLFQCVIPGMGFGAGALWLWIMLLVSVLLNAVVARLRPYTEKDFMYANVIQGGALIGLIGYLVFFFNIVKSGIFNAFVRGTWGDYVQGLITAKKADKAAADLAAKFGQSYTPTEFSNAYLLDGVLIMVYLLLVISSVSYFAYCAQRIACSAAGKKGTKAAEQHIAFSVVMLFIAIIPMFLKKTENLFANYVDDSLGARASLVLTKDGEAALSGALVGLIIMLVAEIAIVVCGKVLCNGISAEDKQAVLIGAAKTPEEKLADAEAVIAEAQAAAAEEAPAEEAPKAE